MEEGKDEGKEGVRAPQQHPPLFPVIFTEATTSHCSTLNLEHR